MASNASTKLTAWCLIALLAACKPTPQAPSTPAPSDTGIAPPTQTPSELEAESSLSIKRGIVMQTDKTFGIRLCAANSEIPFVESDGTFARVYSELGGKPLYIEAYGERVAAAGGSFALEELLYATSVNPTNACTSPAATYELLARGSEPSWSVEVSENSMLLRQNGAPTEIKFTGVDTADTEGAVTYRAGVDKHVLELTVKLRPCRDEISGEFFAYTATAKLDKQSFNGCARVGD